MANASVNSSFHLEPTGPAGRLGPRSHAVQFYDDAAFLARAVTDYFAGCLGAGHRAVMVAVPERRKAVEAGLRSRGFDVSGLAAAGRIVSLDARETLACLVVDGMPGADWFQPVVADTVDDCEVWVYGEMAGLLWEQSNAAAALALEDVWSELVATRPMRLLCSYRMDCFDDDGQDAGFAEVCQQHDRVIPADDYFLCDGENDRLRKIASLQHQARTRDAAIRRREESDRHRRQALEELEQAKAVAQEVGRLARSAVQVRDEFLSIALCELRNPLNAMHHQMVGLLRAAEQGRLPLTRDWITFRIERTGEQASRLVDTLDALLDVSRARSGLIGLHLDESDLAAVVRQSVERFVETHPAPRLALRLDPVYGYWDKARIDQVMAQLLMNIRYGKDEPIEIRVERRDAGALIEFVDEGLEIETCSDGWLAARLCDPPQDDDGAGFSLSLWIVRQLVESMQGTFSVESLHERGCAFSVTLPLRPIA